MSFHTTQSIIESAIDNHKCLVIKYSGSLRLVEPVALGNGAQATMPADRLTTLQVSESASQSGIRTFLLSGIEDVQPTDRTVSKEALDYADKVSMVHVSKKLN